MTTKLRVPNLNLVAGKFIKTLPPAAQPTEVDKTLPLAAKEAAKLIAFERKTKLPKGASKALTERAIERILLDGVEAKEATKNLVAAERGFVNAVLDEMRAWAKENGYWVQGLKEARS